MMMPQKFGVCKTAEGDHLAGLSSSSSSSSA